MSRMWVWALAIVIAIGAWYLLVSGGTQKTQTATSTPAVALSERAVKESTNTYEIDVVYPQFGIAAFDARIKTAVEEAITEIKNVPDPAPSDSGYKNTLDGLYADPYIGPDFLSAKLILSQYTGGAHGLTIVSGVNYDRKTGKILSLDDARALIGLTIGQLSVQASEKLRAKLGETFFEEGANSNPENFSSFAVGTSSVTFIFQQYQVAAYSAGPQEVVFDRVK